MTGNDEHPAQTEVRVWLAAWGACVARRDFEGARPQFHQDVIGFGTKEAVAHGLTNLERDQWRGVWPKIEDFAFDAEGADVWIGPDGRMAVIAASWDSTGRTVDGTTFPRAGRATAVLQRDDTASDWLAVHTHFSLLPTDPGTG